MECSHQLTDRQLEDIAYENKKAYDNGYVKGFHDAKTLEESLMPWQTEQDPEKALEKIFDTIAKEWFITEEPFDGTYRRRLIFTLNRDFNPQKVYPQDYVSQGTVT